MPIIRSSATAVAASGLPLERGGSSVVGRGWAGRPDHDQQHCYHQSLTVNQRLLLQLCELLMMGMRMPETCWAVFERQVINLRNCCIWLVDSVESMMMHGLANPNFLPTIFPYSPHHKWGIYHIVRSAFLFLLDASPHIVLLPFCRDCFQIAFSFKCVTAKILPQLWQQMTIHRWHILRYNSKHGRLFSYQIVRHVNLVSDRFS